MTVTYARPAVEYVMGYAETTGLGEWAAASTLVESTLWIARAAVRSESMSPWTAVKAQELVGPGIMLGPSLKIRCLAMSVCVQTSPWETLWGKIGRIRYGNPEAFLPDEVINEVANGGKDLESNAPLLR